MASLAVSDFFLGDFLGENNMRPWWEKYRSYSFSGQVFCSLSMVYFTIIAGFTVNCLPCGLNISNITEFSTPQAAAVNTYCSGQFPWYILYAGVIELAMTICILFASSYWLHVPVVADSFNTIVEVDKIISDLDMTLQQLKDAVIKPIVEPADEKERKLRKALVLIRSCGRYDTKLFTLRVHYVIRSVTLLAFLLVAFVMSMALSNLVLQSSQKIECSVPESARLQILSAFGKYDCVSRNIGKTLGIFSITSSVMHLAQFVVIMVGLVIVGDWKEICCGIKKDDELKMAEKNAKFVALFWENSSPSRSGQTKLFLDYVFSKSAVEEMTKNFKKLVSDLLEGSSKFPVHPHSWSPATLSQLPQSSYEKLGNENVFQTIEETTFSVEGCEDVIQIITDKKQWGMLACILNSAYYPEGGGAKYEISCLQNINLDELISLPYLSQRSRDAGSVLYYTTKYNRSGGLNALKCLLFNNRDGREKYVHFRGKSVTLKKFLVSCYGENEGEKVYNEVKYEEPLPMPQSQSQYEIRELYTKLRGAKSSPSQTYLESLRNGIYRYKFSYWDENAKAFAMCLEEKKLWKELVTLLNAYIVTEENRPLDGKLDCGVTQFDDVLDDIFRIALLKQPRGFSKDYFVPTAAHHIIACCTEEQRRSLHHYIHDPQYQLDEKSKKHLLDFVKNYGVQWREHFEGGRANVAKGRDGCDVAEGKNRGGSGAGSDGGGAESGGNGGGAGGGNGGGGDGWESVVIHRREDIEGIAGDEKSPLIAQFARASDSTIAATTSATVIDSGERQSPEDM